MRKTSAVAPIILFLPKNFSVKHCVFSEKITVRQDGITRSDSNPFSIPNATETCHCRAVTDFLLYTQQISRLLAIRLRQWLLCKISLPDFCCLCESKSAYFNNKVGLRSSTLLFPWRCVKYRCLLG